MTNILNITLRYVYTIPIMLAVILICLYFRVGKNTNKIKYRHKDKKKIDINKISEKIRKNAITRLLIGNMGDSISFVTGIHIVIADLLAICLIIIYVVSSLIIYKSLNKYALLWYNKAINLLTAILVPSIAYSTIKSFSQSKLYAQLPVAFAEVSSAYRSVYKIKEAIEISIPYMPKEIRTEFRKFYNFIQSAQGFEEGLNYLRKRIANPYIKLFCTILEIGQEKNSDISKQLDNLSILIRNAAYNKEKSRNKMIFYKMLTLLSILVIPSVTKISDAIVEGTYSYFYTFEGSMLVSITLLAALSVYTILNILENNI